MLRSLFAGVSGMRTHQLDMDVIADNIANVNTTGFKASRMTFKEVYSQLLRSARGPMGDLGGVNPLQVGLGVTTGSIDTLFTQGAPMSTGRDTDLAIDGNGFFVLTDGTSRYYTRAGNFSVDSAGYLVYTNGMKVMGWTAVNGVVDASVAVSTIQLPTDKTIPARATDYVSIGGNLDSNTTGKVRFNNLTLTVDDGANPPVSFQVEFRLRPTGNFNEWAWEAVRTDTGEVLARSTDTGKGPIVTDKDGQILSPAGTLDFSFGVDTDGVPGPDVTVNVLGPSGPLPYGYTAQGPSVTSFSGGEGSFEAAPNPTLTIDVFDSLGNVRTLAIRYTRTSNNTWEWTLTDEANSVINTGTLTFSNSGSLQSGQRTTVLVPGAGGAATMSIELDFSQLTQFAAQSVPVMLSQNGYASGRLIRFTVDDAGLIKGVFSNGTTEDLAQIALATFSNQEGLIKQSDTLFVESGNTGAVTIGPPNSGNRGKLAPGFLEMSNVDLSQEFTNLILAQRGFQANSRVITTSDEMLQELMTLKR